MALQERVEDVAAEEQLLHEGGQDTTREERQDEQAEGRALDAFKALELVLPHANGAQEGAYTTSRGEQKAPADDSCRDLLAQWAKSQAQLPPADQARAHQPKPDGGQ